MAELHQDMHDRFDRVDAALNEIYTKINKGFNQIDLQLGQIRGDIKEIQRDLLRVELTVNQLEARTFEFIEVAARRALLMTINGAIGYKERTGLDMPYQPDYVDYENVFHSWATIHAFDALSTGPTERSYTDTAVLRELQTYPLDVNLNYLNTWLKVHRLPSFGQETLPNPRIWGLTSQAYSQLALDWPGHARRIAPTRTQGVKGVGDALQTALQRIVTTASNRANFALFEGLIDYYSEKATALNRGVQQEERTYLDVVKRQLDRGADFDLWGGLSATGVYSYGPSWSFVLWLVSVCSRGAPSARPCPIPHGRLSGARHRDGPAWKRRVGPRPGSSGRELQVRYSKSDVDSLEGMVAV